MQELSIHETKQELERHRSLGVFRRLSNRLVGNYPDKKSRKALERHEMGPYNRIVADSIDAIYWTRKLNATPNAVIGGSWYTASPNNNLRGKATLPYDIKDKDHLRAAKDIFTQNGRQSLAEYVSQIGFYADGYSKWLHPTESAQRTSAIGVVALHDYEILDIVKLSREDIESFDPTVTEGLEQLASMAINYAKITWIINKPERID